MDTIDTAYAFDLMVAQFRDEFDSREDPYSAYDGFGDLQSF